MDLDKLRQINEVKADKALSDKRHQELFTSTAQVSDTILSAITSLIKYLEGHTTKTQVVNQLKNVGTPDAAKVVKAVNELHDTLKTHENVDLSSITTVMESLLSEVKQIPKENPTFEKTEEVKVSNLIDTTKDLRNIEKAVKALKLHVEAPNVNVDAPDLAAIVQPLRDILEAQRAIKPAPLVYDKTVELTDGSVPVAQSNLIVNEKYDDFRVQYSDFDEDSGVVSAVVYYYQSKKVATLKFEYDSHGKFTRGYKVTAK